MIGTERLLSDRQRALKQRLGVFITASVIVKVGQIVQ
jgi:hypothetical protein